MTKCRYVTMTKLTKICRNKFKRIPYQAVAGLVAQRRQSQYIQILISLEASLRDGSSKNSMWGYHALLDPPKASVF